MHDAKSPFVWGQKAAQMGYTETVLNKVFYEVGINAVSVLYVLPAKTPDASDFSSARFDPAVELSPYLQTLFTDTKNIGHKRAGTANIYIRGSRSRAGLKSVPVGLIILDEIEEMTQDNIPLVFERTSGQLEKQTWGISTPSIDDHGINKRFKTSTQEHFMFRCPHCSRSIELQYPDSIVFDGKDSHLICTACKSTLSHETKQEWLADGFWMPTQEADDRGFYINQLYSMMITPAELSKAYEGSLNNVADEQEFFNSKLGLTHIIDGARVTDGDLDQCIGEHKNQMSTPTGIVTMGVDVGTWINYEVDEWRFPANMVTDDLNIEARCKVLEFGKVRTFNELNALMRKWAVQYAVIDAQPERRKSFEFAQNFNGYVKTCFYGQGIQGKQISIHKEMEHTVTVDRTSWMDVALSRFRNKSITLPVDTGIEYRDQIKAPVRIYKKDGNGNPVARYVEGSSADHYTHSRVYNEVALNFAAEMAGSQDIFDRI